MEYSDVFMYVMLLLSILMSMVGIVWYTTEIKCKMKLKILWILFLLMDRELNHKWYSQLVL